MDTPIPPPTETATGQVLFSNNSSWASVYNGTSAVW